MDYYYTINNTLEFKSLDYDMSYDSDLTHQTQKLNTNPNYTNGLTTGETCLNSEEMYQPHIPRRDNYMDVEEQAEDLGDMIKKIILTGNTKSELDVDDAILMTEEITEQMENFAMNDHPVNIFTNPMPIRQEPLDMSVLGIELTLRRDNFFKLFQVKLYNCMEYQINQYLRLVTGDETLSIEISQFVIKEVNKRIVAQNLEWSLGRVLIEDFSQICKIPISQEKNMRTLAKNREAIERFIELTGGQDRLFDFPLRCYIEMYLFSEDYANNHKQFVKEKCAHLNFRVYNIEYKKEIANYLNYFLS
jgi:hypothetical protein